MSAPSVPPDRVHALVVGIERYAIGEDWTLPGPVCDALRFNRWLRSHDVPVENIRLHLAPEPGRTVTQEHRGADYADLRHTLVNELPRAASGLLWVWWGGHGYLGSRDQHHLLTADATRSDLRNVNLDSVLAHYRSEAVTSHPAQVWIVDACATFEHHMKLRTTPPDEQLPLGRPWDALQQMELRAVRRGARTPNDPSARAGHWSTLVLGRLKERDDPGLLPDAAFLEELRSDVRRTAAPPPWLRLRGPDTDLEVTPPVAGPRDGAPATPQECEELITFLMSRPWVARAESRQALVDVLPHRIRDQLPRASAPRHDIVTIVQAAAGVREGLLALWRAARILDGDTA
ncbi:caspase family protein [Streptomyces sp. NPDC050418]|uniref:effector-associated domain 2-containing protein n=1 Tax=Streptomyces sp. NPDC050418 TaxID=3365612 RepID=UPI00378BFE24